MKINDFYYEDEMSRPLSVSTFGNHRGHISAVAIASRVSTCDIREQIQGSSVSVAGRHQQLRNHSVLISTSALAIQTSAVEPTGTAKRGGNGMEAPRGIPPRERPKWA